MRSKKGKSEIPRTEGTDRMPVRELADDEVSSVSGGLAGYPDFDSPEYEFVPLVQFEDIPDWFKY